MSLSAGSPGGFHEKACFVKSSRPHRGRRGGLPARSGRTATLWAAGGAAIATTRSGTASFASALRSHAPARGPRDSGQASRGRRGQEGAGWGSPGSGGRRIRPPDASEARQKDRHAQRAPSFRSAIRVCARESPARVHDLASIRTLVEAQVVGRTAHRASVHRRPAPPEPPPLWRQGPQGARDSSSRRSAVSQPDPWRTLSSDTDMSAPLSRPLGGARAPGSPSSEEHADPSLSVGSLARTLTEIRLTAH